jgi:hypothetical protein
MRPGSQIITAYTLISPNTRINNAQAGTILVSVRDADGNGVSGVSVTAVPGAAPNGGAQPVAGAPANTDVEGCSYVLQVTPGTYTVTVSKTNYLRDTQTTTATMDVTVTANNSAPAAFTYDNRNRYQLAFYSSPAPTAMIPKDLEVSYFNDKGTWTTPRASTASFSRTLDVFPWGVGYTILAGLYAQPNQSNQGCLSSNPGEWISGTRGGFSVVGVDPVPAPATAGGTSAVVVPMGLIQVTGQNTKYLRLSTAAAGPGDPGCAVTMTYLTAQVTSNTASVVVPYGTWKLETSSNGTSGWSTVNASTITVVAPAGGTVTSTTFVVDPRVVAP